MYNRFVTLILLVIVVGFTTNLYAQEEVKPHLSGKRIAGEFFAGITVGTAFAIIPPYLLSKLFPREPGTGPVGAPANLPELIAWLSIPVGMLLAVLMVFILLGAMAIRLVPFYSL